MCVLRQVLDAGVIAIRRSVNRLGLSKAIWTPDLLNMKRGQHRAFRIAQRNRTARTDGPREFLRHIEDDGNRPQCAVCQTHG